MQVLIRILAFTLGLVLGLVPYLVGYAPTAYGHIETATSEPFRLERNLERNIEQQHVLTGELRIANLGWHFENGQPVYRFLIENGKSKSVSYGAQIPERPFPTIAINGKRVPDDSCGSGVELYTIHSGESIIAKIPGVYFDEPSSANAKFTVEFNLKTAGSEKFERLMSEPFKLDKEFRQAL